MQAWRKETRRKSSEQQPIIGCSPARCENSPQVNSLNSFVMVGPLLSSKMWLPADEHVAHWGQQDVNFFEELVAFGKLRQVWYRQVHLWTWPEIVQMYELTELFCILYTWCVLTSSVVNLAVLEPEIVKMYELRSNWIDWIVLYIVLLYYINWIKCWSKNYLHAFMVTQGQKSCSGKVWPLYSFCFVCPSGWIFAVGNRAIPGDCTNK